jgi:DNA-binding GntR family transcriptional regulator
LGAARERGTLGWPGTAVAMTEVTQILAAIEQGDAQVAGQLLPLVYTELRRLAAQKLARESDHDN